jgi:phosphatidylethanolamine/phosphatidyl-N-methylethanolamine N-methyltransferase
MTGQGRTRLSDHFHFLRTWASKPVLTGAVSPSGPGLCRAMAAEADPAAGLPVLELGAGTGPVTQALIKRGFATEQIAAVEFNPDFARLLVERFRGLNVIEGDAYDLETTLPPGLNGPFCAVVSSLPLLTRPPEVRLGLVESALDLVPGNGGLIQFSYGVKPPVAALEGRFTVERTAFVALNIPPARVWRYRRSI